MNLWRADIQKSVVFAANLTVMGVSVIQAAMQWITVTIFYGGCLSVKGASVGVQRRCTVTTGRHRRHLPLHCIGKLIDGNKHTTCSSGYSAAAD